MCRLLGPSPARTLPPAADPNAGLKVLGGDIASNARELTAVMRVQSVRDLLDSVSARYYTFYFSRNAEESYVLSGYVWPTSPTRWVLETADRPLDFDENSVFVIVSKRSSLADVRGVIDATRNAVRITVALSAFRKHPGSTMRPGAKVTYLGAENGRMWGVDRYSLPADPGGNKISYVLGTPSCVPVGR